MYCVTFSFFLWLSRMKIVLKLESSNDYVSMCSKHQKKKRIRFAHENMKICIFERIFQWIFSSGFDDFQNVSANVMCKYWLNPSVEYEFGKNQFNFSSVDSNVNVDLVFWYIRIFLGEPWVRFDYYTAIQCTKESHLKEFNKTF